MTVNDKKHKIQAIFSFLSLILMFCSACAAADNTDTISGLNQWMIEQVEENNEVGIGASDIVIDRIYYGSFSQQDTSEILVLCKFLNMSHTGGLDRTAGIIFSVDSMEVVAYKEFGADEVMIDCLKTDNGESRILFIGTTTYQGVPTQDVQLFAVEDGQWVELPIEALETLEKEKNIKDYGTIIGVSP